MNLKKLILTNNACYKAGRTITPKGIMVHSTGANNPLLRRYVGPDDGLLGKNQYGNHWNQDKPGGRQVCVHGFIGKLADGSIAAYQTLPWNHRGWHAGGAANDTHIGFEICEDGLNDASYFSAVYKEAVELCVHLCKLYGLTEKNIIGHYEGYQQGVASNHGDPRNWFPKFGKSMDSFRADVKALLGSAAPTPSPTPDTDVDIKAGDLVAIKSGTVTYHPGGSKIPSWVISDYNHRITQTTSGGKPVIKGSKVCVLLGKKVRKSNGSEEAGINTWVDKDVLSKVGGGQVKETYTAYTVAKGDSLWSIAQKKLGSGARYPEIMSLNGLSSTTIHAGQVLKIPK